MKNDLIRRQDAKDAVDMALDTIDHVPEWVYDILLNSLDKVPPASPDLSTFSDKLWKIAYERGKAEGRKKGKWIDKSDDIDVAWNYCSVCMEQAIDLYDFCPNCGADMREDT